VITKTTPDLFRKNWNFQVGYYSQIKDLIKQNAMYFISIEVADKETDSKKATDFVVRVVGGDIAVRIRRASQKHRDLTIRSYNNGYRTELQKIKEGFGRFYLYCWENEKNELAEWMLVDLNLLRTSGALENRHEFINEDRITRFIAIPTNYLKSTNCLVACKLAN
jgi:CRISPR/Cas system CSM-associated protein Csm4 (group 5 of RAMP superfamily)